jgi:hypothetical protein
MAKSQDEILEEQIGDLGGENETLIGKKLRHKEAYGGKENVNDLSEEDKASFQKFMSKRTSLAREEEEASVSQGWIPINREEMGIRSQFYPEEWEFFIKPASVGAIKNWTAIDEERPDQVNNVFNDIVRNCLKINTHAAEGAGWAQLNSWDRFWFVLKIREYTFSQGENKVTFTDSCENCGEDIDFSLTSEGLFYEFPDEDLIKKYWNGEVWYIDPTEYDVAHEPVTLYTPKLGKDQAIIDWAIARQRNNQKIDETFIKFLPWLCSELSTKDARLLDQQIQKAYNEYKSWDLDMFHFMDDVINNITINPSEKLRQTCPHCDQEVTSAVQFPSGIKVLFEIKSRAKKFGTR